MAIRIIFGKPGSGKSLYGTYRIIDELRSSRRHIVTNLPLRLDRLNEYLQQRFPSENLACVSRITLLDDEKLKEFYKERGPEGGPEGVAYFLDEAQIPFNARDWANCDRSVFNYLTQHRKKGDDVWAFTQSPGNLDKQFRSLAQEFRRLRNERLVKLGVFRGLDRFTCKHFDVEPGHNAEPFLVERFQLDPEGVASCYDTAAGIGVKGSKADIGSRAKGLTIGWGVAGLFAAAALVAIVPWGLGKMYAGYVEKSSAGSPALRESLDPTAAVPLSVSSAPSKPETSPPAANQPSSNPPSPPPSGNPLWVRGYVSRGRLVQVLLTDGRTLTEIDASLTRLDRASAVVDGQRVYLRQVEDRPSRVVEKAAQPDPVSQPVIQQEPESSAWEVDKYGVSRIKKPDTLATMFKPVGR